jgi:Relaxase/Mobilisation nuclease domain
MVPRIGKGGSSFKGAGLYYLHDKDALTAGRVAFTHTENLETDDASRGFRLMYATAMDASRLKFAAGVKRTGGPAGKPVWTMSLAWHPEQQPDQAHMIHAMRSALKELGLEDRQAVLVAHNDEAHPHIHAIVNLIHPETGRTASVPYSKIKLSKWAEAYEKEHGKIYCQQRVFNNAARARSERVRYREPELDIRAHVTKLYHASDSGKAFQAALAETGFSLAQGRKILLIDPEGKQHSLTRQIEGGKAKDIRAKLADVDLPQVEEVREQQEQSGEGDRVRPDLDPEERDKQQPEKQEGPPPRTEAEPILSDRDQQERDWQEALIEAALQNRPATPDKPERPAPSPEQRNALQERHHAELGRFYADNQQARDRLAADLGQQYGDHERQLRKDIARLEKSQKVGIVRRLLSKVTRRSERQAEELKGLRRGLDNLEWRRAEAWQGLENRITEQAENIRTRQAVERLELEQRPDNLPERGRDPVAAVLEQERRAVERSEIARDRDRGPEFDI